MAKYTREDIIRIVKEENVEFIRMQFTDIFGQLKNVAITASQIEKAVNNEIMIDGSSIEGFVRINQSCLGNVRRIARFDASIGGSLMVTFENGHRDYVSRRQLKTVKERMGM